MRATVVRTTAGRGNPDANSDETWAIQDDSGDLVALCDLNGDDGVNTGFARVVGQWTFDAYGEVLSAEWLHAFAQPRLGHKGLFLVRLDETGASPGLIPFAHNLYHNRNRTYAPGLGRFLQRDPNQTAMALVEATAMHGRGLGALSLAFSMEGVYGDGGNLYEYLGSNPWTRSDVLGLSWDPFDMVDDFLAESMGSRAAFLSQVGQAPKAIAIVAANIASTLPIPIVGIVGDLALFALGEQPAGVTVAAIALGIVPGGKLLTSLTRFLGRVGESSRSVARHYASRGHITFGRSRLGLTDDAARWVERKPPLVCGCFAASTLVWTASGAVPIESVAESDAVLTAPEDGLAHELSLGRVADSIVIETASLVTIRVRISDGQVEDIATTDEHPFFDSESATWMRADELSPGIRLAALKGDCEVLSLRFGNERVPVFNLAVPGTFTYFVGPHQVWTHNCVHWHTVFPSYKDARKVTQG